MIEYPEYLNITKVVIKNRKTSGERFRNIEVRVANQKPEMSTDRVFQGL